MAKVANLLTRVYIDEFDFSDALHTADMTITPELAEVTSFSDTGPRRVMGSYDHTSGVLGYFEPTNDAEDEQLHALTTDAADPYLLHLWGESTGNLTGVDFGTTTSSQTLQAVFRVLALTGSNITLNVQQSSDNGSSDAFATISGMTSGSLSAIGVVRTTTLAATERYLRVNIAGTFDTATIVVSVGRISGE
jgi:hypothetical protein